MACFVPLDTPQSYMNVIKGIANAGFGPANIVNMFAFTLYRIIPIKIEACVIHRTRALILQSLMIHTTRTKDTRCV